MTCERRGLVRGRGVARSRGPGGVSADRPPPASGQLERGAFGGNHGVELMTSRLDTILKRQTSLRHAGYDYNL